MTSYSIPAVIEWKAWQRQKLERKSYAANTSEARYSESYSAAASNRDSQAPISFTTIPLSANNSLQHVIVGMLFGSYAQILQIIDVIIDGLVVLRREPIAKTRNTNSGLSEARVIQKLVRALEAMYQALAPFYIHNQQSMEQGEKRIISGDPSILQDLGALGCGLAETKEQE